MCTYNRRLELLLTWACRLAFREFVGAETHYTHCQGSPENCRHVGDDPVLIVSFGSFAVANLVGEVPSVPTPNVSCLARSVCSEV